MLDSSINDVVYSIKQDTSKNQEVNFKFIYNLYEENETTCKEDIFEVRQNIKKKRFIRINIENSIDSVDNILHTNDLLSFVREFENKNLYEKEREVFNRIDSLNSSRANIITDIKEDEILRFFNIHMSDAEYDLDRETINKLERSNNLSIKLSDEYTSNLLKKDFPETFNYNNLNDYESLVYNENSKKNKKNNRLSSLFTSGELFPNLNIAAKSINLGDVKEYADLNCLNCGRYIEKFVLNSKTSEYDFLCGRFYLNRSGQNSFDLEDEAINYGKTYRYVLYNVYLFTSLDKNDRFIRNHYLVCSHPYISNDIICKEYENPPEPVDIHARYDFKNKNFYLYWQNPTNYQGDVRGFQILKRTSIDEPFTVIGQLEGHSDDDYYEFKENVQNNIIHKTPGNVKKYFKDISYRPGELQIYAVRSIDAHGMVSDYSEQIGVYFDELRSELISRIIAYSGANVLYPNEKLIKNSIFYTNDFDIVDNLPLSYKPKKIRLYITPDHATISYSQNKIKVLDGEYQFTMTNINNRTSRSDKFTINNFG